MNNMHKNTYIFVFIFSLFLCNSCLSSSLIEKSSDKNFSTQLWLRNKHLAIEAYNTPFVQQMKDGTLPIKTFEYYLYQDIYYLEAYSYSAKIAAQYATDVKAKTDLERRGNSTERYVNDIIEYFKNLSLVYVPNSVPINNVTISYISFLFETARTKSSVLYYAAITPCSRLYAYLGWTIKDSLTEEELSANKYKKWIEDNSYESPEPPSPTVERGVGRLEALLDHLSQNLTRKERDEVEYIYMQGYKHEIEFFSAPKIEEQIVMIPQWKSLNVFNIPLVF